MEYIAHDWCGWDSRYGRYTHIPSGQTLVCQSHMDQAQLDFLSRYPGLNVHNCDYPGPYSADRPIMSSVDEICVRLRAKLARGS